MCRCGRNLAQVKFVKSNPTWTIDSLTVIENLNVDQQDFRPWPKDPDADMYAHTYSWTCRCGSAIPPMKHERISALWELFNDDRELWTKARWRYVVNA